MDNHPLLAWLSSPGSGHPALESKSFTMENDDISGLDTPEIDGSSSPEKSSMERQLASLQTFVDSLPYKCESVGEMQARLWLIVGKIDICARSKNWSVLTSWDSMLQW